MVPSSGAGRALPLLIAAQVLAQTSTITLISISALIGFDLAADKSLATLPVAASMLSGAALTIPASLLMARIGRRGGFTLGAMAGLACALLAVVALRRHSFGLFISASVCSGAYQAFFQFYRFAATDAAAPERRSRVLSLVVSGGIVAAFAGPALARYATRGETSDFGTTFQVLAVLALIAVAVLWALPASLRVPRAASAATVRDWPTLLRQPLFLTALCGSAVGMSVMVTVMTSTPLAMQWCGIPRALSPTVIQWHMLGMFVPSLFVGDLIRRFGVLNIMLCGAVLLLAQCLVAVSGVSYAHFVVALALLGLGWNFLYVGGSSLLAQAWRPGEESRLQGAHDLVVFTLASLGSLSSGALLQWSGWNAVNLLALPAIAVAAVVIVVQWRLRGAPVAAMRNTRTGS